MGGKRYSGASVHKAPVPIIAKDELAVVIYINNDSGYYLEISKGILTMEQTEKMVLDVQTEINKFTPDLPDAYFKNGIGFKEDKHVFFIHLFNFTTTNLFDQLSEKIKSLNYEVKLIPVSEAIQHEA